MRSLKKVLSLVLALVFVLALATIGASAAYSDNDKITHGDAVATTSALGIFNGYEDGSFNPSGNITRQEACKIIAMALNGGDFDPALYADASIFTDVDGLWGEGYINYLAGQGIVAGMGDGTFNPQGNITAQELAKILLVALGYPAELFTGSTWATYTNRVASSVAVDLYEDYVGAYSKALTREEAALLIYNALLTDCVQATWASTIESMDDLDSWSWTSTGKTFLQTYFNCVENIGFVTATSTEYTELTDNSVVVSYGGSDIETTTTYKTFMDKAMSATDKIGTFDGKLGDAVTVYTNSKTKAVVAVAARTVEEDEDAAPEVTYSTTAFVKESAMKTALKSAGIYNALVTAVDEGVANYAAASALSGNGTDITFKQFVIKSGMDYGDYTPFGATATVGSVTYGLAYKINTTFVPYLVTTVNSSYYTLSAYDKSDDVTIYKTESKNTDGYYNYDTLTKGDWYTVKTADTRSTVQSVIATKYGSCTPIKDVAAVDTVAAAGTSSTAYSSSYNTVTLDGTTYGMAAIADAAIDAGNAQTGVVNSSKTVYDAARTATSSGVTGADLFLDPYGYIFAAVKSDSSVASVSDYCYIIDSDVDVGSVFDATDSQVEVLTDDGTYAVYDLAFKKKSGVFYSGSYAFTGTTKTAIETELNTNVFSYTVSDGVLTIVDIADKGQVSNDGGYVGVVGSKAAQSVIAIDGHQYTLSKSTTEFDYMNINNTTHSKSTVASVGLSAAQSIPEDNYVYYVTDSSNTNLITKLITIGAYTGTASDQYIYLSNYVSSYQNDNGDDVYVYEYYSNNPADSATEVPTMEFDSEYDTGKVYAVMSDGSLDATDLGEYIFYGTLKTIVDDSTVVIDVTTADADTHVVIGTTTYSLTDDLEAVIAADDANYEEDSGVAFTLNSSGEISGLWIIEAAD